MNMNVSSLFHKVKYCPVSLLSLPFTDIIRLKVAILVRGSVRLLVISVEVGPVVLRLLPAVIVSE